MIETLLGLMASVTERLREIPDAKERAKAAHRVTKRAHELTTELAVVRQDAVRSVRAENPGWSHRDTAGLLDVSTSVAGRIANTSLHRKGQSTSTDGSASDDRHSLA